MMLRGFQFASRSALAAGFVLFAMIEMVSLTTSAAEEATATSESAAPADAGGSQSDASSGSAEDDGQVTALSTGSRASLRGNSATPSSELGTGVGGSLKSSTQTTAPKPRSLLLELYNETRVKHSQYLNEDVAPTTWNWVGVMYKIDSNKSWSLRQAFDYQMSGPTKQSKFVLDDTHLQYSDAKLIDFRDPSYNITMMLRAHAPTGEVSRELSENYGNFMAWFIARKRVGKIDFNGHLIGRYWAQSRDNYEVRTTDSRGAVTVTPTANTDYRINPWAEVVFRPNPKLWVALSSGIDTVWYRPLPGQAGTYTQMFTFNPSIGYSPNSMFTAMFMIENIMDNRNPKEGRINLFRPEETTGFLMLAATI